MVEVVLPLTRAIDMNGGESVKIWVFVGENAASASAVFASREAAESWIVTVRAKGTLTAYPLDLPVYDWAIANGFFHPTKPYQEEGAFIGRFTSAYLEHCHYCDGNNEDAV
jgi:hypothetical protein